MSERPPGFLHCLRTGKGIYLDLTQDGDPQVTAINKRRPVIVIDERMSREQVFQVEHKKTRFITDSVAVVKALCHREFPLRDLAETLGPTRERDPEVIFDVYALNDKRDDAEKGVPMRFVLRGMSDNTQVDDFGFIEWEVRLLK